VPVLAVWAAGRMALNAIPRLLAGLSVPHMGVIGPWALGIRSGAGANIDFLRLAVRWWDHWLRGATRGCWRAVLRADVRRCRRSRCSRRPGLGGGDAWPSTRIVGRRGRWQGRRAGRRTRPSPPAVVDGARPDPGRDGRRVVPLRDRWRGPELPGDQAPDDARSVCFDTEVLGAPGGAGRTVVRLAIPRTWPGLVVCACDVWPDGRSTRVSYALRHANAPGDRVRWTASTGAAAG
jgi:hypothetical protein